MFKNSAKKIIRIQFKTIIFGANIVCKEHRVDRVNLIMCIARALIYSVARLNHVEMIILNDGRAIYNVLNMIKRNVLSIAVDRVNVLQLFAATRLCAKNNRFHTNRMVTVNVRCKFQSVLFFDKFVLKKRYSL